VSTVKLSHLSWSHFPKLKKIITKFKSFHRNAHLNSLNQKLPTKLNQSALIFYTLYIHIPNIARTTLAKEGEDLSSFFFRFGRELHQMNLSSDPRPSPPLPAAAAIRKQWILFKSQFLFKLERRTLAFDCRSPPWDVKMVDEATC
jgi:hypothetical protein